MSKRNKAVSSRTYGGSGGASGGQITGDASRLKASDVPAEGARQRQGTLTADEVDRQIRRFFESGKP